MSHCIPNMTKKMGKCIKNLFLEFFKKLTVKFENLVAEILTFKVSCATYINQIYNSFVPMLSKNVI